MPTEDYLKDPNTYCDPTKWLDECEKEMEKWANEMRDNVPVKNILVINTNSKISSMNMELIISECKKIIGENNYISGMCIAVDKI